MNDNNPAQAIDQTAQPSDNPAQAVGQTAQPSATPAATPAQVEANVIAALRTIYDPEIPVNIYDLGLIYGLGIEKGGKVDIRMTLTAPACPVAGTFPDTVEQRLYEVPGVSEVRVELVWEPAWSMDRLSEEAKLQLGLL